MKRLLVAAIAILLSAVFCSYATAHYYTLEIIAPRAGLDTKNRFYKAYPGLEYNVRLAVIGGVYPFTHSLTTAPSGMTINTTTGEITWSNPTVSGSPHTVTARVVDSDSPQNAATVTWTITVTTSGFLFIDGTNGKSVANGGTGTLANPWKSMVDLYEGTSYAAKHSGSWPDDFVYWRAGTYALEGYYDSGAEGLVMTAHKPKVWLAYPGETVIFDLSIATTFGLVAWDEGVSNVYLDGFSWNCNTWRSKCVVAQWTGGDFVFRRNTSYGIVTGYQGGNSSLVFLTAGANDSYYVLQDNEGYDVDEGYWLLGYSAYKVLIEDNVLHNIGYAGQSTPVGIKGATDMWFVRHNRLYNNPSYGIAAQCGTTYGAVGNLEISFNYVESGGGTMMFNNENTVTMTGPTYVFRNTIVDDIVQNNVYSTNGPWYYLNNVIINATSGDKITKSNIAYPANLIVSNNLTGTSTTGIIDSNGLLVNRSYVGTYGWETGTTTPPSAQGCTIQGVKVQ